MNINSTRQHASSIHLAGLEPLWQRCSAGLRSLTKFTLGLFSWCSCNPMKNVKDSREPDKVQLQPVRTPPKAACLCVKEKELDLLWCEAGKLRILSVISEETSLRC